MSHLYLRQAVSRIIERGDRFDDYDLALCQLANLAAKQPWAEALFARATAAMPAHSNEQRRSTVAPSPCAGPLPETPAEVIDQFSALIVEHSCWLGRTMAQIAAIADLWPHATRAERLQLRRLWLSDLDRQRVHASARLTRGDLLAWQRRIATMLTEEAPSPLALERLTEAANAEAAYRVLSNHLGPDLHVPTLSWMLGAVAQHTVLHRFDIDGLSQWALLGTMACEQLANNGLSAERAVILLCQLGHQIWWCHNEAGLKGIRPGSADSSLALDVAVTGGDCTAAQRAARQASSHPRSFWPLCGAITSEMIEQQHSDWPRAVHALTIAVSRAGSAAPAPDDAACLGASLAAATWLSQRSAGTLSGPRAPVG
ncbi:MAG: hypothetical protein ACYTF0_08185 [Planctomycetota bacterium]|jgi:hypothetical protein